MQTRRASGGGLSGNSYANSVPKFTYVLIRLKKAVEKKIAIYCLHNDRCVCKVILVWNQCDLIGWDEDT